MVPPEFICGESLNNFLPENFMATLQMFPRCTCPYEHGTRLAMINFVLIALMVEVPRLQVEQPGFFKSL
jgi:hypothetical protein